MGKLVALLLLSIALMSCVNNQSKGEKKNVEMVWVCTGNSATTYHNNRSCRGLNNCRATIEQMPVEEAEIYRRPCKTCYNN